MRIVADCDKIRANARAIVDLCAKQGIEIAAVTKSVCGEPEIVRAILAGGVTTIAESRLDNVRRIRDAGIDCSILMLRLPALREADEVVALTQCSLNSEPLVLEALAGAAVRQGRIHDVIIIIESGDRREGVMPEDAAELCRLVISLPGLDLAGVATSLNCLCGSMPTVENQRAFAALVETLEAELGTQFRVVSGGHTNNLQYVMSAEIPQRVTQLRVGEGVIFGTDVVSRIQLPSPHRDTFRVYAEVIELKHKPSAPAGPLGPDAFMRTHDWPDLGIRRRAVLAMGEIDLSIGFLKPAHAGVTIVGASSDHTVVDVTDADPPVALGDEIEFDAEYTAIALGWSSICTTKIVKPLTT